MKTFRALALAVALNSIVAHSEVTYSEKEDDFSNEKVYSLKIPSDKGESALIFISCYPESKLNVQLAITGTMFPDDTSGGAMIISTTHKFDKAEEPITSDWFMNLMKYENAWYQGNKVEFAKQAAKSSQLNIRLNKRNDVFRFPLQGVAVHLKNILIYCGSEI